jgi:fused signal recognition particle receptor
MDDAVAVGLGLAFLLLAVLVVRKLARRGDRARAPGAAPQVPRLSDVPAAALEAAISESAPGEEEARQRSAAEGAREQADALRAERGRLESRLSSADDATKTQLDADLRRLRTEEEELRKQAYRAGKAADVEEKERRRRDRDGAERIRLDAQHQAAETAALAVRRQREDAEKKVRAEGGHTLAAGLAKTKNEGFVSKLNRLFGGPKSIDEGVLSELEDVLFSADIGVATASRLVEVARDQAKRGELNDPAALKATIRREIERIVNLPVAHRLEGGGPPHVVMVIGVNGAGKTTTIGKLASRSTRSGKRVILAAGDTFRAAAAEQLEVWAARAQAELVKGKEEGDPASVVFDAVKRAIDSNAALVIADTAGRLHTKLNLMEELKKVRRVIDKALPGAPHEILLVLDATNGQNAIAQARQFHEAVGVTGIALTKLDGTAKGGVIIGICDELKVPVLWAGVGEQVDDLRPFDPHEFVSVLFE